MKATLARPEAWQSLWVCVLLVLAVLAVFGQTGRFAFIDYDDHEYVYLNSTVRKGLSAGCVGWAFTHAQVSNWIPMTTLSHMFDCQFFGLNAGAHHLVNVFWHTAAVVMLFLALREMSGKVWPSALVAAIFAIHPLRAESVAWVSERKDVLSGFFFMAALWAYVRYARRRSRWAYLAVALSFALGLMAKGMVATLPFVLLLLDYWPLCRLENARQLPGLVWEKIPIFMISAAGCVAAALVPGILVAHRKPFLYRVENALVSYITYLRQFVFPAGLETPYSFAPKGLYEVCAALLLLILITALAVMWRRRRPFVLVGWLWYLGMLFPVIGIVQISSDAAHADRYTYLPAIGLAMAVAWTAAEWRPDWRYRRVVLGSAMAGVVGALGVWGYTQTSFWRSPETLWARTLSRDPNNFTGHYCLAMALADKGEKQKAAVEYRTSLKITPLDSAARNNLGIILADEGHFDEAIEQYRQALDREPDLADTQNNLANALFQKGDIDGSITQFKKALRLKPDSPDIQSNLGFLLFQKGDIAGAIALFQKALQTRPDDADVHNDLGLALDKKGDMEGAVAEYRRARAIKANFAPACRNLGKDLIRRGDYEGAMECLEKTVSTNLNAVAKWRSYGASFLQTGDLEEAIACFRQALRRDPGCAEACVSLGLVLFGKGDIHGAVEAWQRALELKPDETSTQNNLAWVLATSPETSLRSGTKALALAKQAEELTGGSNPAVLHTLAAAYAELGRYQEATNTARRALALATAQSNSDLTIKLPAELKLYEAGAPLRDPPQ